MDISLMITSAALSEGIDPNLALAVAQQESGLNQSRVSSAGAIGVMQLMPATAAALGVDPYDAEQNIQGGVKLLAQLLGRFGDVGQALGAYNWRPSRVASAVATWGSQWLSHAPRETQNYVTSILGRLGLLSSTPTSQPSAPGSPPGTSTDWLSTMESEIQRTVAAAIPNTNVPGWVAWVGLGIGVIGLILEME